MKGNGTDSGGRLPGFKIHFLCGLGQLPSSLQASSVLICKMGCYSVAHSPGPPPLSQALLAGLVYSRERSRQDGQSPCDLAGQAGNTRQVNLGPPGDEHTHGGVRWLGGLDQIIHTDGFAWGSVQDAVYLASEGTLVCRALCWGPGTCDTHSWACKMLGQGGWQSPPAHQQVRQKQHLLVVGLLCLPTPCPGRRDAEPLPEPRDWAPGGTLLGAGRCFCSSSLLAQCCRERGPGSHFTVVETEAQRNDSGIDAETTSAGTWEAPFASLLGPPQRAGGS